MSDVALAGGLADRRGLRDTAGLVAHDDASLAGRQDGRRGPFAGGTGDRDARQRAKTLAWDCRQREAMASAAAPPTVTVTVEPAATLREALRPTTFPGRIDELDNVVARLRGR